MPITVRKATKADVPTILGLLHVSFVNIYFLLNNLKNEFFLLKRV